MTDRNPNGSTSQASAGQRTNAQGGSTGVQVDAAPSGAPSGTPPYQSSPAEAAHGETENVEPEDTEVDRRNVPDIENQGVPNAAPGDNSMNDENSGQGVNPPGANTGVDEEN